MSSNMQESISTVRAWCVALTATLTMAVSFVDRQTLAAIAPSICDALHISDEEYGWLQSAFSVAYLVGAPLAGRLIDRIGPYRGLIVAVLVWSIVAGVHALSTGFVLLVALRIALGLAEAPSFPGSSQTVTRVLEPGARAAGYGLLFTGSSLGAAVAAPLAIWLESRSGWRFAFLGTAAAGLIWLPVWLSLTSRRDLRARLGPSSDRRGRLTSSTQRQRLRLNDRALLRAIAATLAAAPPVGFIMNWSSKLLVSTYTLRQRDLGRYLWLAPVCFDLGSVGFGSLASFSRRRNPTSHDAPRALFAAAVLLGLIIAAVGRAAGPWSATLLSALAMIGGGGLYALITADLLSRVPPRAGAFAAGFAASAQSLALIVANPLIGRAVRRWRSYRGVCVGLALWLVPGAAVWLSLRPPPRTDLRVELD